MAVGWPRAERFLLLAMSSFLERGLLLQQRVDSLVLNHLLRVECSKLILHGPRGVAPKPEGCVLVPSCVSSVSVLRSLTAQPRTAGVKACSVARISVTYTALHARGKGKSGQHHQ